MEDETEISRLIRCYNQAESEERDAAFHVLLAHAQQRLEGFTRAVLGRSSYEQLARRTADTDDIRQDFSLHLLVRQQEQGVTISNSRHFFNLAGLVIRRRIIDLGRRARREPRAPVAAADSSASGVVPAHDQPHADLGPLAQAGWDEIFELLERYTGTADECEAFNLRYVIGLSVAESAKNMGVSERTVKRYCTVARDRLADMLAA